MIAWLALMGTLASLWLNPHKPQPFWEGEVSLSQVEAWKTSVIWIDARVSTEYDQGHIPGALLLNEDKWNELLGPVIMASNGKTPLVVYCDAHCNASLSVAQRLKKTGLDPVYLLKGGWESWKRAHP